MKPRWLGLGLTLLCLGPPLVAAEAKKPALKSFRVPYRLTDTHHVLVRVKINGKGPFNFIIDTGAPALFVATAVGKKLGVSPDAKGWGTFDRFEIEGGVVETKLKGRVETPFQLEGMNALGAAGAELHGILGYNVLARYRMEFDFTRDTMTWTRLDFDPGVPKGLGRKGGAPGGLDTVGSILKMMGALLPRRLPPDVAYRGFLGVELGHPRGKDEGVLVKKVLAGGPADRGKDGQGGLKAGDLITHLQGDDITDLDDFRPLAAKLRAGKEARFTVKRAGKPVTVVVTVGEGL